MSRTATGTRRRRVGAAAWRSTMTPPEGQSGVAPVICGLLHDSHANDRCVEGAPREISVLTASALWPGFRACSASKRDDARPEIPGSR